MRSSTPASSSAHWSAQLPPVNLQIELGFHYGFGTAVVSMAIGLIPQLLDRNMIPAESKVMPDPVGSAGIIVAYGQKLESRVTGLSVRYSGARLAQ